MSFEESEGFGKLLHRDTLQFVTRCLLRLGASESQVPDLAQEVVLTALRKADQFDHSRACEPWLWGIAKNHLRDHRKGAWNRRANYEDPGEGQGEPDAGERDWMLARSLHAALATLSDEEQLLVLLNGLENWTIGESADALGMTRDTAKYRLGLAKASLRKRLGPHAEDTL